MGATTYKAFLGNVKMKKGYIGSAKVYSAGNTVTYKVDIDVTYQEEVDDGASCLSPKTFTPAKSGWTFVGWMADTTAGGSVLSAKVMGDDPITLYAVFKQAITLSYSGNGAAGGSTAAQTGYNYYNNGNTVNPSFTLRSNGFTNSGYNFSKWALGSEGGTQYSAGASITLAASATMYAVWTYVGSPFYIVEGVTQEETGLPGGVVRSPLNWTVDGAGNGGSSNDVSADYKWNEVGAINPRITLRHGGSFTAHSNPIATNGNHTLYIRFNGTEQDGVGPSVGIDPNTYASSVGDGPGMASSTFDVTGLDNVTIYVSVPGFRYTNDDV